MPATLPVQSPQHRPLLVLMRLHPVQDVVQGFDRFQEVRALVQHHTLVLIGFVELGALAAAFDKLGLSAYSAYLLLITTLAGSFINVPLFRIRSEPQPGRPIPPQFRDPLRLPRILRQPGRTVIAVNVGGALVPVSFCAYLIHHNPLSAVYLATCIAAVTLVAWLFSRPIRGLGIGIPILIAPITAAAIAYLVDRDQAAPLAYIGGTLGVLIGADLLHLRANPLDTIESWTLNLDTYGCLNSRQRHVHPVLHGHCPRVRKARELEFRIHFLN